MSDVNQETQGKNEDKIRHVLDEDRRKSWVEFWSKESDNEVGQKMENWMSVLHGVKEVDAERANIWKCGMRWAVEPRRKQRRQQEQKQWRQDEQEQEEQRQAEQGQNKGQEQSKEGMQVRLDEEEQLEEAKTESTDKPEVTGRLAEIRTGRGSSGLVRVGDEKSRANETSRKGKGKGN